MDEEDGDRSRPEPREQRAGEAVARLGVRRFGEQEFRRLRPAFGERKLPRRRIGEDDRPRRAATRPRRRPRPRAATPPAGRLRRSARTSRACATSAADAPAATARAASSKGSKRQPNLAAKSRALSAERLADGGQQRLRRAAPEDRARGRVEIGRAEMDVGLEIGALAPFVPGVDADDPRAEERPRPFDQRGEPALVFARRRADQRQALALPARVVVPGGNGGLEEREIRRGLGERSRDEVVVGEDVGLEGVVENLQPVVDLRQAPGQLVRRKFDRAVEAERARIDVVEGLRHHEDRALAESLGEQAPPALERRGRVGDEARAIDHQQRPAVEPDIAGIAEMAGEVGRAPLVVSRVVVLGDQHLVLGAVPAPRPVLVGPHQAEADVDVGRSEEHLQRLLQQPPAVEIIVVEHEAADARPFRHRRLGAQGLRVRQDRRSRGRPGCAADNAPRSAARRARVASIR